MFTKKECSLISDSYFRVIRQTDDFIEFQSKNTCHCWIIKKTSSEIQTLIKIYHKHTPNTPYYHMQSSSRTVTSAIENIKNHDQYVICNC